MDAIIYFSKKRGLTRWSISPIRQEGYLLVKVAADADKKNWFGRELPREPQPPEEPALGGWLKKRRTRRAAQREYQRQLQEFEESARRLEEDVRQMADETEEILRRAHITGSIGCVYERELSFLAGEDTILGALWNRFWDYSVFQNYTVFRWMEPLLAEAKGPDFILLGTAGDVPRLLENCARRMKELRWYLCGEDRTEETEEIAEDFYTEYGLALSIQTPAGRHPFRTLDLTSREPVCVLDLTAEGKIFAGQLAPGSVWIDFLSIEEKEERIRRLCPGVRYVSLKKRWKEAKPKVCRAPVMPDFAVPGNCPGYNPRLRMDRF